MIRLERSQSPVRWRGRHQALATAYQAWGAKLSPDDAWADPRWRDLTLEAAYHRLCSDPPRELAGALAGLACALDQGRPAAAQWAQMIAQVGDDMGAASISDWGKRLDESLSGTDVQAIFSCADLLLRQPAIASSALPLALRLRGRALYLLDRYEEALADLDRAIELGPDDNTPSPTGERCAPGSAVTAKHSRTLIRQSHSIRTTRAHPLAAARPTS